jgi:hypothetical protein
MTPEMKEKLILRMFGSIEYMEKFVEHYVNAMDAAEEGISYYKNSPPADLKTRVELKGTISMWENKALPNFRTMRKNAIDSLSNAKQGQFSTIRSCAGNLHGFSKDMDGITDEWWPYVEEKIENKYSTNLKAARTMGANIYWTLSDFWEDGELINERITGPIEEEALLKHLKPGETV